MKKRIFSILMCMIMVIALSACSNNKVDEDLTDVNYEIAMITDSSLINNGGYSESAWSEITKFSESKGYSHKYYKVFDSSKESYVKAIDKAISGGAKIIVTNGDVASSVIKDKQNEAKGVKFVIVDAAAMLDDAGNSALAKNTTEAVFKSEEAGFLAGYAAVKDGFKELGFMGDGDTYTSVDYGYGFLQGTEFAASEIGTTVNVKYYYTKDINDREEVLYETKKWYEEGTKCIYASGVGVEQPVIEAAEGVDKFVIATRNDKSKVSDNIVLSTVKNTSKVIEDLLNDWNKKKFPGGESDIYNIKNNGIGLAISSSRLENFEEEDYDKLIKQIVAGDIVIKNNSAGQISDLQLDNINVITE